MGDQLPLHSSREPSPCRNPHWMENRDMCPDKPANEDDYHVEDEDDVHVEDDDQRDGEELESLNI